MVQKLAVCAQMMKTFGTFAYILPTKIELSEHEPGFLVSVAYRILRPFNEYISHYQDLDSSLVHIRRPFCRPFWG